MMPLKYSIVRAAPSPKGTRGRQPSLDSARLMSGLRFFGSSGGRVLKTVAEGDPVISLIMLAVSQDGKFGRAAEVDGSSE